jgi:hypothetical protein
MARERLQELRRALFGGDAAAMVAAVEANRLETCLQLAGELIMVAAVRGACGAAELAERGIAALRGRGWDGDDELADALHDAVRGTRSEALEELAVDLEEVADLLEGGPDSAGGRIDLTTGEVWPEFALEEEWTGKPEDLDADDADRWLAIWPSGSGAAYRDMVDFVETRTDAQLAGMLEVALDGRGAFRRFKNVLFDWPEDCQEWFVLSDDRRRGRARAWLAGAGYRATFRPLE